MPHNISWWIGRLFHSAYPLYILTFLFLIYLLNQIDRYLLTVQIAAMRKELEVSDGEYGMLTGWGFTIIYTICGVIIGFLADQNSSLLRRTFILFVALVFWSLCTFFTSFSTEFWHLLLTRVGLAIGEAASSPISYSLLADFFSERHISKVMSFYSFGIYCGYGAAFSVAALIPQWRWTFGVLGIIGLIVACTFVLTVWEPKSRKAKRALGTSYDAEGDIEELGSTLDDIPEEAMYLDESSLFSIEEDATSSPRANAFRNFSQRLCSLCACLHPSTWRKSCKKSFNPTLWRFGLCRSSFWLLCLAAGVRSYVGFAQAAWLPTFLDRIHHQTPEDQAKWFTWIPPLFGVASATCGGILGDFFTNRLKSNRGRIVVCVASNMLVLPLVAFVLLIGNSTLCYLGMIPVYIIAEQWAGNASALISLVVPADMRTFMMSVYFLVLSLIGGCGPYVVGLLNDVQDDQGGIRMNLLINMGGGFILSSVFFFVALFSIDRDVNAIKEWNKRNS